MTDETKAIDERYNSLIEMILRGTVRSDCILKALRKALEFRGRIPRSYFIDNEGYNFAEYFEVGETKADARRIREELIEAITNAIKSHKVRNGKMMLHDHYARLFHALTILKVEKNTELVPGTLADNFIYNAVYYLWQMDDGSENAAKAFLTAAWFLSEHYKSLNQKGYSLNCLVGRRCC